MLADGDYGGAVDKLSPFFSRKQPNEITDDNEWTAFLVLLEQSRRQEFRFTRLSLSEDDRRLFWVAIHDLGLAWHYHMKQAIATNRDGEAQQAFSKADAIYESVIHEVVPTEPQEWRRNLVGLAMQNRAAIRRQMGKYRGDQQLLEEANRQFEKCQHYYEKFKGSRYLRAIEE